MRNKTLLQLKSRYDEVFVFSNNMPTNPEDFKRFLDMIAHYMYLINHNKLLKQKIHSALFEKTLVKNDKTMIKDADQIINQLKADSITLINIAKRKKIPTIELNLQNISGALNRSQLFQLHINNLKEYLNKPKEQYISELPTQISYFMSAADDLKSLGSKSKILDPLINNYRKFQKNFSKRLRIQGLRLNYLRINDYRLLENIRKYIYQEATFNEQVDFFLENGGLIDESRSRSFSNDEITKSKNIILSYLGSLQRLNNYLVNEVEHVSWISKCGTRIVDHFFPTFLSLIGIVMIWAVLRVFGINIDPYSLLKDWIK